MLLSPPVQSGESVSSGETVKLVMVNASFPKFQFCLEAQTESLVTILSVVFLEGRDSLGSFLRKRLPNTQTERALVRRTFRQRRWAARRGGRRGGQRRQRASAPPGRPSHLDKQQEQPLPTSHLTSQSITEVGTFPALLRPFL